jgi:hypothetical protein
MPFVKDEHYDIVSVLYHSLQGASTCNTYIEDAEQSGDKELGQFFREAQEQYNKIATRGRTSSNANWLEARVQAPPFVLGSTASTLAHDRTSGCVTFCLSNAVDSPALKRALPPSHSV